MSFSCPTLDSLCVDMLEVSLSPVERCVDEPSPTALFSCSASTPSDSFDGWSTFDRTFSSALDRGRSKEESEVKALIGVSMPSLFFAPTPNVFACETSNI